MSGIQDRQNEIKAAKQLKKAALMQTPEFKDAVPTAYETNEARHGLLGVLLVLVLGMVLMMLAFGVLLPSHISQIHFYEALPATPVVLLACLTLVASLTL